MVTLCFPCSDVCVYPNLGLRDGACKCLGFICFLKIVLWSCILYLTFVFQYFYLVWGARVLISISLHYICHWLCSSFLHSKVCVLLYKWKMGYLMIFLIVWYRSYQWFSPRVPGQRSLLEYSSCEPGIEPKVLRHLYRCWTSAPTRT